MNYEDAGVSLKRANAAMVGVKKSVRTTFNAGVLGDIGNFGGLFTLNHLGLKDPVLVSSVDGVGTKLKVHFSLKSHNLPGQDIVNHCCNDILVQGARPLFFLDYLATGMLESGVLEAVVEGMAKACRENECVLIGGETAEMPGMYHEGEYDISGTIVGVVERDEIIDGKKIVPGTVVLGLPSTGLHTNGYSLARKALFEAGGYKPSSKAEGLSGSVGEVLAVPHRSYYASLIDLVHAKKLQGLVHITGSGFQGNIPRILPKGVSVEINRSAWEVPEIFNLIQKCGNVERDEMYNTFNMGIGMLVFAAPGDVAEIRRHLENKGETVFECGRVIEGDRAVVFA
ncbi:MAG: phosphoribosylformylglycinamidine cyclo-ligase [Fibromonadaceae bacterium]|jgi:phosphoribosylformylglycinamidine cyclo-ligase|nr:phosphoribosylformylglycinamidine cyclo-ligase [Fibromonadaceae bacterium]